MLRWFALFAGVALFAAACSSGSGHGAPASTPTSTTPESARAGAPTSPATSTPTPLPAQRYEPTLPVAIQEAAATTTGNRLYVVGGYDTAGNSSAATFVFDGSTWSSGPALPIAINHPGAATINATVYVAGGFTPAGATNRVFELAKGGTSWRELSPMRRPRGALSLVAVGNRLYAIGGRDRSRQIAVPERYDPTTNTWTDVAAMPQPRNHAAGFVDGASVCVAGGRTPGTSGAIDCFDTKVGLWSSRASLPAATSGAAAVIINGVTFVAGGEPSAETRLVDVVQRLVASTWTTEPMLVPRHGTAFTVYGGRLWMCGGATAAGFHAVSTCTSLGA